MLGDELVKQPHGLVEGVRTRDEAQPRIVEQGLFAEFLVEASRISIVERTAGIFRLVGLGIALSQIIGSVLCKDIAIARHLLQIADGAFVVLFHHLADTHLEIRLT